MAQLYEVEGQQYSFPDDATEDEIFNYLRKDLGIVQGEPEPEPEVDAPSVAPEPAEGFFERTADVVESGARNFAGSTATGLSSALEYFDAAPETQDQLDAFADKQEAAAQQIAPVKALQEAEGVGDVASSAYEYLAQSSPHMAAMLGGAWAGGKAGAALTSWIPPVGWGAVARGIGTFGGGLLGGATATFNSFFGNNVQEAEQVKGRELNAGELENAAMAAAGQSVADAIISKLLPHKGSPSMLRNTIKKFMQGSAIEGTTEVFQETLGILQANDFDLDSLSTPEAKYRLTEAALAGAAIGGPLGGITGPFTTTKPAVQTEEPPPQPETEVETAETEEVLALPKPATTPTGDDAQGTVEGDPVEFVREVSEQWPTGEALPLEFNIEEDAKGWRIITSDNRVLTPYFKERAQADQALMAFREEMPQIQQRRAEDVIQREADRALEGYQDEERAALQSVARELVMPVTDFSEQELFEALGRDEKKVSRVLAGLEKLPNGLRDEITWEDVVTLHNKRPKLVTQADLDILLDYKKPETAKGLVQPADILTIAESMNISTRPTKRPTKIGKRKRKKHIPVPSDESFRLFAKRLTGRDDIYKMSQTQLQVLADGLSKINNGQPFDKETRIPIAERPPFTETQIERAAQGLKTDETFAEEKGQLKPAPRKSIMESITASTEFLDEGDRQAVFDELVRRRILLKDKGGKYKLRRPVRVQRLTFEEEIPSRPRPEVNPDGTYGSQVEGLEIIPGQVDVATEIEEAMRARLDRRGLKDVRLAFVDSIPNQPSARAMFRPGKNGKHLILLALEAIPMDVRGDIKKIHERLAARLDHEAVHALVENGVITPADMDRLSGAIESEIAWDWDGGVRSDETYYNQAKRLYTPLGLNDVAIREEAIANMFRDFTMGKTTLSPAVKSIWQKIVNFFRDIALSAREKGVNDARELFQRIDQAAPAATVTTNESHSPDSYSPPSNVSDTEMGGVKLEVASRGTVPASISTNSQLAAITDYFNRNMRRLQLVGAMTRKWKLDRIIPDNERVAVRTDYRTKAAINEGVLDNVPPELSPMTGQTFSMQGVHLLSDKTGNPNLEDVAGYDTSVTLNDVEFRIDEGARNDLVKGVPTDVPPALTHGNIVKGEDSTDGVPIVFNPYRQHLFVREDNGLAVKGADQVTLVNGKAYARGSIDYWTEADAPATEAESNVLYQDGVEEYARPSLDLQGPDFDVSSLSTLYDPAFPTEKPGSRSIWQIITRLADRALAAWGGPLAEFDQENMETVARIMSAEAREALKKSGNAADWYAEDINKMVDVLALNGGPYPELKTDGNARAAFSLALAVTSINTQVESNMKNALAVYDAYKQTGKFPNMGWGVAASGMRKKFKDMNKIIDDLGLDGAVTFMNTPFTKAQLVRLGFPGSALAGVSPEGRVYGSYLLGPKLGSFYQNLMGNYDTITMDKWFMRTWNRITGQFPTEQDILVAAQGLVNGRAGRSANRLGVDLTGAQDSPDATIDAAIRLANALDREWQQRKKAGASADQKLGVTTQAQAFQDLMSGDEVPGAAKRTFMDQTVRRALEILGDYNINVPPASFQAIIWYPEQDLFRKMGMQPEGRERSFGAAAAKAMKEKGYGGQVDATIRALARRGAQPTGRDVGNAALSGTPQLQRDALEGRDRTRFIRYHTAKAFRESFGPRFGTKKSPTPYERKSAGVTQFVLADGTTLKVPTEAVYTPKKKASDPASPVNYLIPAGISMPKFVELKYGDPEAVSFFHSRIMNAQASTQFADAVTVYPQEAYQEKRLFVTLDGGAGFALDNGDIQSMFKDSAAPYQQVSFSQLVMAIDQGGRTLDAFDTVLPELYSFLGFEPVSRVPFESVALPEGVDVEAFKKNFADFRGGSPDLVFMVFNPNNYELYSEPSEDVRQEQMSADYDEAVEAQDIALSEIRTGINDGFDMDGALYELGDLRRPSVADHNQEFWDAYNKKYAADRNNQGDVMHPNTMVPAPFATRDNPTTRWGKVLWRDLDDLGKVLPVEVNVRLGYDLPNKNGFISGYGQRHAQAHDEEFRQYTPYPSATAALEAFLQEFADQTAAEGLTDKNSKKKYINRMMSKDKDLSFSAFEQGDPERANRKVGFEWSQPGLRNPIRFAFTAYRDRQTGRMALTLVTAYPVTQQVNRAENKRRYRDRKSNVKEYHPEKLSEVAREAASAAEEMTPKAQQKLVSSVVHKGGTLTLPKPKIDDKARSFYSEPYDTRTKTDTEDSGGGRGEPTRDRGGRDASRSIAPLTGAPTVQGAAGPDPTLVRVAEDYAAKVNIPFSRQGEYVSVDPEFAARIALAYEAMPHAPNDPAVKAAYASLIEQTLAQYEALTEAGYTFTFFDSETDPYEGNPWNAMRDLRANKTMAVYGTYDGYGTEGITGAVIEENPMLADTGLRWPDQGGEQRMVTANDLFRAVHDAFGHGLEGAGFRGRGEENAFQAHVRLFTGDAVAALTSETRGQNSWLNFGPHGKNNQTAKLEDTVFAEQKTGLMPSWTWEEKIAPDFESPDIRYELSDQQRRVMDGVGGSTTKETFADKILRVAQMFGTRPVAKDDPKSFPHFGQWFRTNVFDRFDPIRRGELRAWQKLGNDLRDLTADVSAWAAFRMLKRSIGVFQTALTRGVPTYRNGIFTSEPLPEGTTRPDGRPITIGGEPVAGTEFGLLQIFEPLVRNRNLNRPDTMREFQSYGVARRAARLIQEGRQRLMTVEDIITQLALADTIPQIVARFNNPSINAAYVQRVLDQTVPAEKRALFGDGRSVDFQEIFDAYQAWNSGQVQMMVDSGVISQEMAQTWIETSDYIPYYRQMAEKNNYGNLDDMFKIYNNIRPPEKLVGEQNVWTIDIITTNPDGTRSTMQAPQVFNSEEEAKVYAGKLRSENGDAAVISDPRQTIAPMLDLLETVSQNSLAAIQTSMANVATQRAVRNLVLIDEASVAPKGVSEGVVRFRVNGEEKAYLIHDPAMYASLTVLDDRQGPILKLFGMPANLLRNFVTRTPEFMLSNMLRDTLSAWAVSGKNGVPVLNTAVGFVDALRGSTSGKALSAAGVWAGHDFQDDPTDAATAMRDLYVYRQRGGENWWNPVGAIYNKLGKWSAASDAATRIKVYEDVLRETGNEAQAVFEAVEVLNFGAKGASGIIKVATATIPFLNARLQGLDLFYRASGIGTGNFTADSQSDRVKRRFWARGATLAALSAMYWQLVHDDEDWLAQEAHTKDSYWIIPMPEGPPIKIPIPFEVGLIFKVIPERLMGYIKGQETNRDMFDSFKRGVQSTLEINPYPQAILPYIEAANNYSYFTGRPIEPKSMADGIEAGHRYNERTSQLAISMGRALNDARHVLPEEFISPMRIDHMMKGYTGTLGTYILDVADWGWRNLGNNVERPSRSAYEYPVMRRFFAKEAGRGIVTQAYELMDEVNQALNTLKKMEETAGLRGDAMEFAKERRPLLDVAAELAPIKQELADLRKERQNVFADPAMTADQKQRALAIIATLEGRAVQDIPKLRRWAFD